MSNPHDTTIAEVAVPSLAAELAQVPDPRDPKGQSLEWLYLLEVVAVALLAGQRNVRAIAQWTQEHAPELVASLRPRRARVPSRATLYRVMSDVPIAELEAHVSDYCAALDADDASSGRIVTREGEVVCGQSLDGKTVRGASAYGQTHHLVSLVRHASGVVLKQTEAAVKLDERKVALALLTPAQVAGTLTTLDALHTQRKEAEAILAGGGDYLMMVKRNQRCLFEAIELAFSILPPTTPADAADAAAWDYACCRTVSKSHGRLEVRTLERLTGLNTYLDWPGVAQVLRRTCRRTRLRTGGTTGETTVQVRYAITSLSSEKVSPEQTEQFWRWHWTIENQVHYVRDVSMGEDAGQVHTGNAVEVLAALRNAVIALLRSEGWPCLPTAFRHFAAHPQLALHLMGAIAT
jgi:predicted transposase YbfD/YdcC